MRPAPSSQQQRGSKPVVSDQKPLSTRCGHRREGPQLALWGAAWRSVYRRDTGATWTKVWVHQQGVSGASGRDLSACSQLFLVVC